MNLHEPSSGQKPGGVLIVPISFITTESRSGVFEKAWKTAWVAAGRGRFIKEDKRDKKYEGIIVHDLRRSCVRHLIQAGVGSNCALERWRGDFHAHTTSLRREATSLRHGSITLRLPNKPTFSPFSPSIQRTKVVTAAPPRLGGHR